MDIMFSLRQLQEKCKEQQRPLYLAFIDLTKAFDQVCRSGLFMLLQKIGCPPHLQPVVRNRADDHLGPVPSVLVLMGVTG